MSETLSFDPAYTAEFDNQSSEPAHPGAENRPGEEKDTKWGDALTALVGANANVIVKCPWMGGAEVTLAQAMSAFDWPPNLTAADEPYLMGVVYDLLANRVEIEETQEEESEEEKPESEAENPDKKPPDDKSKEKVPDQMAKTDQKNTAKTKAAKEPDQVYVKAENSVKAETVLPVVPKPAETAVAKSQDPESGQPAAPALDKAASSPERALDIEPSEPGKLVQSITEIDAPNITASADSIDDSFSSAGTTEERPVIDSLENPAPPPTVLRAELEPLVITPLEPEPAPLPLTVEILEAGDTAETEFEVVPDEFIESAGEAEVIDDEPPLIIFDTQIESRPLNDFTEEVQITIEHFEEDSRPPAENPFAAETGWAAAEEEFPAAEPLVAGVSQTSERNFLDHAEASVPEPLETGPIIENTEEPLLQKEPLLQIVERIEASPPETIEMVEEILDKIKEASAKLDEQDNENTTIETEVQEELEELFIGILDGRTIEYTPELIESLVSLTLNSRPPVEMPNRMDGEAADESLQDTGTHEIIKKLLIGLSDSRKPLSQAYTVGRSALQLFLIANQSPSRGDMALAA